MTSASQDWLPGLLEAGLSVKKIEGTSMVFIAACSDERTLAWLT